MRIFEKLRDFGWQGGSKTALHDPDQPPAEGQVEADHGHGPLSSNEDGLVSIEHVDRGVVSIDGQTYAVGLSWVPVVESESLKGHAETARKVADGQGQIGLEFSLFTGTKSGRFYGFATPDLGHERGQNVLIDAMDAGVLGENWIAVLPIKGNRDRWWVGGRRDGSVFEDRVFEGRDAASQAFMESLAAPDWTSIIAPEEWRIHGSIPGLSKDAISGGQERLRLLDPVRVYAPRIVGAVVLAGILAGSGFYFWDKQQRHIAEMEELRRQVERAVTLQPQDHPWYHRTRLDQFLAHCTREINDLVVLVSGWENEAFTCQIDRGRGTVSTGWRRAGGNTAWLRASMPADFPALNLSGQAEVANVTRRFQAPIDPEAVRQDPWSRETIENRITERFQLRGVPLSMRYVADRRPADINPLFHRHDIHIQGTMPLEEVIPFLGDIPALIPDTLSYNLGSASWSLIVRVHHPVIVPEIRP